MKGFGDLYRSKTNSIKQTKVSKQKIINQAIQLHLKGNISEATKFYQQLINEGCNDHRVFSNYGIILQGQGNLKDAELYTRKAIALKTDYAEAYSNLGGILSDLGNLKDAELYTRKAIKLNPDYAEAHSNLGNILSDLGKLNELILLSESTLKSRSINQGYKLLAALRITIASLLKKDFSETLLNINKTNDLIIQQAFNAIEDEKNKKYSITFSRFINSLYPLLIKNNKHPDAKKILHLGESHCLSFAHQTISLTSQVKTIQPVLITGGKAWHFSNKENNRFKDSLTHQIKNHKYSDEVFISFGEIDCRKDEGILNYAIKNDKDISKICEETIKGYLLYMEKFLSPNYSQRYYFGIPAPTREKKLLDELDIKRIKMVKIYNSLLKQEVLSRGSHFLDVYALTSTKNGENNNLYMCDKNHLSPKCLCLLFANYLHKGKRKTFESHEKT